MMVSQFFVLGDSFFVDANRLSHTVSVRKKFTYPPVAFVETNISVCFASSDATSHAMSGGAFHAVFARGKTLIQYSPSSALGVTDISGV